MYKIADLDLNLCLYPDGGVSQVETPATEFQHERMIGYTVFDNVPDITYEFRTGKEFDLSGFHEVPANINRKLYQSDHEWLFIRSDPDLYPYALRVNKDWSFATIYTTKESIAFLEERFGAGQLEEKIQLLRFQAIMENFRFSVIAFQAIYLHGVYMEYENKAIILSAPSQTGKSTHASLWTKHEEASIINGDNCVIRKGEEDYLVYGLPWCGSSGIYQNKTLPLGAVVFLEQAPCNEAIEISKEEAFMRYYKRSFLPSWDVSLIETLTSTILDIVSRHKSYVLRCRPDREAVEVLKECLKQ